MTRSAPNLGAAEGVGKNRSSKIHIEKNLSKRKIASKHRPMLLIHLRNLNENAKDVDASENQVAQTQEVMLEAVRRVLQGMVPGVVPGVDLSIHQHTTLHLTDDLHYHN